MEQSDTLLVDERIFPSVVEWRTSAPKDKMPSETHDSAEDCPESRKVKTGTRPRAAHEVPLLTVTASRVIEMKDTAVASGSSGTPSTLEKSPLDFANEDPPQMITKMGGTADQGPWRLGSAVMGPIVNNKRYHIWGNDKADAQVHQTQDLQRKTAPDPYKNVATWGSVQGSDSQLVWGLLTPCMNLEIRMLEWPPFMTSWFQTWGRSINVVNDPPSAHVRHFTKFSSSVGLCLFDVDLQLSPSLVPLSDTLGAVSCFEDDSA
ncbi:hypothetical protein Tco_1018315 [Tanacetum coccineum]|uniref:Uncharacterized protein n=1 Tax=Tanacetum coccineum TaxID=301880 RepID=A0ABQ5FU62_9ASTR